MYNHEINYSHHGSQFTAYVAYEESTRGKPLVFVCHAFQGRDGFSCSKAEALAKLGYVGVALDLYGSGVIGTTNQECSTLMAPLMNDRVLLRERLRAGIEAGKKIDGVDVQKIAAIGFCFGGLVALDIARNFSEIAGVVSFHGLLTPPPYHDRLQTITSKVLALHGWRDPLVPPPQLDLFAQEMLTHNADWQLHCYGQALHAFTRPGANDPGFGTVYNARADHRSWQSMQNFLAECFMR